MVEIEVTDEFLSWFRDLAESEADDVTRNVEMLENRGVSLPYPYSSKIKSSRHGKMRELRVQSGGKPIRVFYAFDPRRQAILLIGGDKTGDENFYNQMVPIADTLYDKYLEELRREGRI